MYDWSLEHVSSDALHRDLKVFAAQGCVNLAKTLAHIGEVDARLLWRDLGYPRVFEYCLRELHFSEGATSKRLQAARAAREFPAIFDAVAEGRIHLSGIVTLRPWLTARNVEGLLQAATHKTREEIEKLIAARFPRRDLPQSIRALPTPPVAEPAESFRSSSVPESVAATAVAAARAAASSVAASSEQATRESAEFDSHNSLAASELPSPQSPGTPQSETPRTKVTPLSATKYGVQVTIEESTYELLRRAQDLLAFQVPRGDIAAVLHRALELLVRDLERRKCAATDKPRPARRPKSPDVISASVRREVWQRDQSQCTFVNEAGRRCPSRSGLEVDHMQPKARAALEGRTTAITAADVRLLCRAHNQLLAERAYGAAFMQHKREWAAVARESGAQG